MSEKISAILALLREIRMSPADLLLKVLTNDEYNYYQAKFFGNEGASMTKLLDAMTSDPRGERIHKEWALPSAIDTACDVVSDQMDAMVKALSTASSVTKLTPAFLRAWSLKDTVAQPANDLAPDVVKILSAALNTERALIKNKKKNSDTVRGVHVLEMNYLTDSSIGTVLDYRSNCISTLSSVLRFRRSNDPVLVEKRSIP
jgi:hypothetical protein